MNFYISDNRIYAHYKMPARCSAPRCTNSNKERYGCINFARDPNLRQKWIDAVGISDWKPPKSAVLCEVSIEAYTNVL